MSTLRIYSPNSFSVSHTAVLGVVIMLYITFPSAYLSSNSKFVPCGHLPPTPCSTLASDKHKSDLFFHVLGFFFCF